MGRAGSGGGGGGSRSSGSRSSSRSSGGHRSSSRAGGSSFHSRSGGSNFGGSSFRSSHRSSSRYGGYNSGYGNGSLGGLLGGSYPDVYKRATSAIGSSIAIWITVAVIVMILIISLTLPKPGFVSSRDREKINSNIEYNYNCIIDEIYWFDSPTQTASALKEFYDETGIQPYVVLNDYDESLTTDEQKLAYAEQWYEDNIDNEATFLFMYFAERDVDNDVGFMCYVSGLQCNSVMDGEAVDIFWNYIDTYWYSDMSTDDLFEEAFCDTADTIMTKSRTLFDILWVIALIALIAVTGIVVVIVINKKRKAEKEKAEETERILNTPMQNLAQTSSNDELIKKYDNQ